MGTALANLRSRPIAALLREEHQRLILAGGALPGAAST
jgi:hypothetical protein